MKKDKLFYYLWVCFGGLLFYWAIRLWSHFPAFMDTMEYVFPEKWFNVESFRQGRIPLWNPYIACGTPHLAAFQPAAFYPFFWIWNLTGLTHWFFVMALLHETLAAVGFYLWLRALKVSPLTATLCAWGFAGSAMMAFYWGFPTHLASAAWVPWIFWASWKLFEKPSFQYGGLLSLFWTFQILAGYPFCTFYTALFFGVFFAFRRPSWKVARLHFSAIASALGLTACQWLPFVDFLGFLHREGWGDQLYSLHWKNELTLFQPQILGVPGTEGYQGDYPSYLFDNLYLGLVPLGIWVWSFFSPYSKDRFWKFAALFWPFWFTGIHFPLWRIFPEKILDHLETTKACFLFVFCAFTAIALSLQEKTNATPKKSGYWKWAWLGGALWAIDLLFVPARVILTVQDPYQNPEIRQAASKAQALTGEGRLASLREAGKIYPAAGGNIEESILETAGQLVPNTNVVWGLKSVRGYLSICTDGFQNLNRYLQKGYPYDGRVLDAAGVNLILFSKSLSSFKYDIHETNGSCVWTRNAGAMPTAWVTEKIHEFPDRPSVFTALLDPKAFLENEVYTERKPDGGSVCLEPSPRTLAGYEPFRPGWLTNALAWLLESPPSIQSSRFSPCEAGFQLKNTKQGFLVFDESYSPGWHAWVDGEPKAVFRAYGLFMAVPLAGEGDHQVIFRYEPGSFRLGLFVSLLFLVAGGGLLMIRLWTARFKAEALNPRL